MQPARAPACISIANLAVIVAIISDPVTLENCNMLLRKRNEMILLWGLTIGNWFEVIAPRSIRCFVLGGIVNRFTAGWPRGFMPNPFRLLYDKHMLIHRIPQEWKRVRRTSLCRAKYLVRVAKRSPAFLAWFRLVSMALRGGAHQRKPGFRCIH